MMRNEKIFLFNKSDLTGSKRIKRYRGGTVILVPKKKFKIEIVISIPKYKKWKGYISSGRIRGTVIFDPVKPVEQLYLFHLKKLNSYISYDEKSGTVLSVPIPGVEQLYLFQQTSGETVIFNPPLY